MVVDSKDRRQSHFFWLAIVALLIASAVLILPLLLSPSPTDAEPDAEPTGFADHRRTTLTSSEPDEAPEPPPVEPPVSRAPEPPPKASPEPPSRKAATAGDDEPPSEKPAKTGCWQGDVWSLDDAGRGTILLEECGIQLCRDGTCEKPSKDGCGEVGAAGQCDGDVMEACYAGRIVRRDCAEFGRRCVVSDEHGASCRALDGPACNSPPRCDGRYLEVCEAGVERRIDCGEFDGRCEDRGGSPACVRTEEPLTSGGGSGGSAQDCGPCGCSEVPAGPAGEERCDGGDNDGDGEVDEGVSCAAIPVVFVLVAGSGTSSYSEADAAAELALMNHYFETAGLTFELREVRTITRPDWLTPDDDDIAEMHSDRELHTLSDPQNGERWFVPVVLVDVVMTGLSPKLGVSTLPSGGCGTLGHLTADDAGRGVIVLSKGRHPTTGAHEMGHYLGLCHTHASRTAGAIVERGGDECAACSIEGDGVCDTPTDPGPGMCQVTDSCGPACRTGDSPDTSNLMSYYHHCRSGFTPQQVWLMRRTLAARRALDVCARGGCSCTPDSAPCPTGLSCRPGATGWSCGVAGNRPEGGACREHAQCAIDLVCAAPAGGTPVCGRVCSLDANECRCAPMPGTGYGVCVDDT